MSNPPSPQIVHLCQRLINNDSNLLELASCSSLTGYMLPQRPLTHEELVALLSAISKNTCLKTLSLSCLLTALSRDSLTLSSIKPNLYSPSLIVLRLCHNGLKGEVHGRWLGEILNTNEALVELDVFGNQLGDSGVQAMVMVLLQNAGHAITLKTLDLSCNRISDAGVETVSKHLLYCTNDASIGLLLRELYLDNNYIGDDGCKALAYALKFRNNSLQILSLRRQNNLTKLSSVGVNAIEDALHSYNSTLRKMNLPDSPRITNQQRIRIQILCHQNGIIQSAMKRLLQPPSSVFRSMYFLKKDGENNATRGSPLLSSLVAGASTGADFALPLSLWPRILEIIQSKPEVLHSIIRSRGVNEIFT